MRVLRPISEAFATAILAQRGSLMPWSPVVLAVGIGVFFAQGSEPPVALLWALLAGAWLLALLALRADALRAPLIWAVMLVMTGFALAGLRAHLVAGPVLDFRYYGPIEGRVVGLDRSASGATRVTLDEVRLTRMAPGDVPLKVRVSLHGDAVIVPPPGAHVMTTGHLSPPSGPTEPGGFDFQRHVWFLGIGGVGYTRVPLLMAAPPDGGNRVFRLRMALSDYVQRAIPGDAGGFAAAVTTGDRSALSPDAVEALRITNLAHLLAISGLHMGLLTGFIFAALRYGLALAPLGAGLPARKIAAALALVAGAFYLALSGGSIATERAFIMVAVAFVAVLIDRRAISLRSVAVAALIVLTLRPEALLGPGFQMSFAATTALVVTFGALSGERWRQLPPWSKPLLAVLVSSLVAGLATLPVAAAHFNRMASFGLIANLMATPVMGSVVVPAGVIAALLSPFGLDWLGFRVMEQGLRWILGVAHWIAGWEGSARHIKAPPGAVLPLLALSAALAVLWQGRIGKMLAILPAGAAAALWLLVARPDVLIADTGGLVGVMTEQGRALSKARGAGFVAGNWLENDGDPAIQAQAAARWPGEGRLRSHDLGGVPVLHAIGKTGLKALENCPAGGWLVASVEVVPDYPCRVLDPARLRDTGSIALYRDAAGLRVKTAREVSGTRLWNDRATRRAAGVQ